MDARIAWTISEMHRRLADPLTVSALARAANLSPSRFAHLFRATTGVAPARFLRELRFDRARVLLENTTLPVRDVMTLVGGTDASHFARDYCRRYGQSPRASRRTNGRGRAIA